MNPADRDNRGVIPPLHLGALHPVEQALTLLLAFGPFLVLAIVVAVRRREDAAEDAAGGAAGGVADDGGSEGQRDR